MKKPSIPYVRLLAIVVLTGGAFGADYALRGLHRHPLDPALHVSGGDPQRGRQEIIRYGCGACHVVPGIRAANGRVGPRLEGLQEQIYIAGVLRNTPEGLIAWIQDPREINPQTAMPDLGVTADEARDIAAYLYRAGQAGVRWRTTSQ